MKRLIYLVMVLGCVCLSGAVSAADASKKPKKGKLRHVVSFKFKEAASAKDISGLVDAFAALKDKVPQIRSFEWGKNTSPEKHDKGFTHVFVLSFEGDADRDAYLVHPAHQEFGKLVGPVVADVFVVDFWASKKSK